MLIEKLKENGIYEALLKLGFPAEEMFKDAVGKAGERYESYSWVKSECHVPGIDKEFVINAIPDNFADSAWEEWYSGNGLLIHHILCADKWAECTDETFISKDDKDHPAAITGRKWYYFEDTDLRPYFARG